MFVSDTGVARGSVYGLRISSFALVLAARGHRVIVISPAVDAHDDVMDLGALPTVLAAHDWSRPLILKALRPLARLRVPTVLRRAVTALSFALWGGTDHGWRQTADPLVKIVGDTFRPDVIWATFGTTSNLAIAQTMARRLRVPWVADLKDNVDVYLPTGTRRMLARRFADVAALTSNAELHAEAAKRWLHRDATIVRSGIAADMAASAESRPASNVFLVTLIGSVYSAASVDAFLAALARWASGLSQAVRTQVRFRYAGIAVDVVQASLAIHPLGIATEATGTITHAALAVLCHAAAVNCYVWSPATFHHKALELLACRRPIVAFPGEHPETLDLATRTGGSLMPCGDADSLAAALDRALDGWRTGAPLPPFDAGPFSWEGQGDVLEAVLCNAAHGTT